MPPYEAWREGKDLRVADKRLVRGCRLPVKAGLQVNVAGCSGRSVVEGRRVGSVCAGPVLMEPRPSHVLRGREGLQSIVGQGNH